LRNINEGKAGTPLELPSRCSTRRLCGPLRRARETATAASAVYRENGDKAVLS
jgi:hypothetical protein